MTIPFPTGYICILVALACCVMPARRVFYVLMFFAPLTTVAALNLGDPSQAAGASVLGYHLIWLVLMLKVLNLRLKTGDRLKLEWLPFLLFCLMSTTFAMLHTDVVVLNVDNEYGHVRFSFQQFTQWGYLLVAVSTAWFAEYLLRLREIRLSLVVRTVEVSALVVIAIAFLQLVLPADLMTALFRNAAHVHYMGDGDRISSTFQEPSMLSLFFVPLIGFECVLAVRKPRVLGLLIVISGLLVCLLNNSSSAFLGFAIIVVLLVLFGALRCQTVRLSHMLLFSFAMMMTVAITFIFGFGLFETQFDTLLSKLSGKGVSGSERTAAASWMFGVFMDHPILGVGWGAVRSYDLATTWLAELGLVGFFLFFVPLIGNWIAFFDRTRFAPDGIDDAVLIYCMSSVAIMLVSVNEPYYLSFWLFAGIVMHLAENRPDESDEKALVRQGRRRASAARIDYPGEARSF